LFLSFEGIDGSGKSTQAALLAAALLAEGETVVQVREPGGTPLGERIRSLLLRGDLNLSDRAELLLFAAARAQLVEDVIQPARAAGAVVVADRFFDSTTAYQGGGRGVATAAWLSTLHAFVTSGSRPDRTYLVDLDPDLAAQRRQARSADRIEQSGSAFHHRVREAYLQLAAAEPMRVVVLDGRRPVQELHKRILEDLASWRKASTR
jgi:dTMP kinase